MTPQWHAGRKNFSYFGSAAFVPGHAAEVGVVFPARRLRHGVMSPGPRVPDSHELRSLRPTPVARSSEGHPMTDTPLDGRPTAARTHRTATVILCIRIGPIESALVGHVTAGSAAVETDCMPTPLQRDAGEPYHHSQIPRAREPHFSQRLCP